MRISAGRASRHGAWRRPFIISRRLVVCAAARRGPIGCLVCAWGGPPGGGRRIAGAWC